MPKRRVRRREVVQPLDKEYRYLPLTQNQFAIVDAADFDWLNQWNWFARWSRITHSFYARRNDRMNGHRVTILMSREIMKCGPTEEIDHISHDTLDNRKSNLRIATGSQNCCNRRRNITNRSGYKGVRLHYCGKWEAQIECGPTRKYIGLFCSKEDAARAYDEEAKKLHGEFAYLNLDTNREAAGATSPLEKS